MRRVVTALNIFIIISLILLLCVCINSLFGLTILVAYLTVGIYINPTIEFIMDHTMANGKDDDHAE